MKPQLDLYQAHILAATTADRLADRCETAQEAAVVYHRTYRQIFEQHQPENRCNCPDCRSKIPFTGRNVPFRGARRAGRLGYIWSE
jgi:DNA-directed RNA polymerase subunit RPC12/RpoP